jgi:orotidine-5'-phosphate decarboxylase
VALDTADLGEAIAWAEAVSPYVGWVKVGLQLYTAHGPRAVQALADEGVEVFLDLKLHDIPNTVRAAVLEIAGLGASLLNVHASGGPDMMAAAIDAAKFWEARYGRPRPLVLAVTLLTSINEEMLRQSLGITDGTERFAMRLAAAAKGAGLDGVVASPQEAGAIKREMGSDFLVVTPGIRSVGENTEDQRRVDTAGGAIRAGSDLLVIGRSITQSSDPSEAAKRIAGEVAAAI